MMDTLQILFLLVLLLPVLGTALSLVLADNTTQVIFKWERLLVLQKNCRWCNAFMMMMIDEEN